MSNPVITDERSSYQIGPDTDMRCTQIIGGKTVCIGEPLCDGCDSPIADGPCGCQVNIINQASRANRRAA